MRVLPERFRKGGFDFQLVERRGDLALFVITKPNWTHPSYEVVIVRKHPARKITGRDSRVREYGDREAMPKSEDWGIYGWTYSDLERAKARFKQLVQEIAGCTLQQTPHTLGASKPHGRSRPARNRP